MMAETNPVKLAKAHLTLDLWVVGAKLEVTNSERKLSVMITSIHDDNVFILGIFMLDLDNARRYLALHKHPTFLYRCTRASGSRQEMV